MLAYGAISAGAVGACDVIAEREEAREKAHYESVVRPAEDSVNKMLYEDRVQKELNQASDLERIER